MSTVTRIHHPVQVLGTDGHDNNITGHDGEDIITGYGGYDYLRGNAGNDCLDGGAGNDQLHAGDGDDILIGGAGYDYLYGDAGNDDFLFSRGDSYDVIFLDDADGTNRLVFGEEITVADLLLVKNATSLEIRIKESDDKVILPDWYHPLSLDLRLDSFVFADGTELSYEDLIEQSPVHILGDDTANGLSGHGGEDIIIGGAGDDWLNGNDGDDLLLGGTGNDALNGGYGNDTFIFNLGDGQDSISGYENDGIDTLTFGEGIALSDFQLEKADYDLVIKIGESGDQVTLPNWFHPAYGIKSLERISFSDGSTITCDELLAQCQVINIGSDGNDYLLGYEGEDVLHGNAGNDILYGYAGNDSLDGGDGDDTLKGDAWNDELIGGPGKDSLYGGSGDDTFRFNLGDGQDIIYADDAEGNDTLVFGPGISSADLTFVQDGNNLVISVAAGDQLTLQNWFASGQNLKRIDRFVFDDGQNAVAADLMPRSMANMTPQVFGQVELGHLQEDASSTITAEQLLAQAGDPDGDSLQVLSLTANRGSLAIAGDGVWTYTPLANDTGEVTFSYQVSDGLASVATTATLNIDPVNDAPIISGQVPLGGMVAGESLAITEEALLAQASDVDGDALQIVNLVADNGSLTNHGDGTWTFLSDSDFNGTVNFSYLVSDAELSAPATASLIVNAGLNVITGTEANNSLSGTSDPDQIIGYAGNDSLYGYGGNDILDGGEGIDTLQGGDDNDELIGGTGNDSLYGGSGDDVFRFNLGDGQDTVQADDAVGVDTLAFGEGIALSDLQLQKVSNDLIVKVGETGDQIKLSYWFHSSYVNHRMDSFAFGDGTTLTRDELLLQLPIYGTDGTDSFTGDASDNYYIGGLGNDSLYGYGGNDTLEGGLGIDTLQGGDGDDTYRFNLGDGADTLNNYDTTTSYDRIWFKAGVDSASIALFRSGNNLQVGYGADDQITISNYFSDDSYKVDELQLGDGSYLTDGDVNQLIQQMAAFAVDEGIAMNSLDDVRNNQELMTLVANAWHSA
ncbi:MAG: cadherin-like domain-containing protein [Syntrophotaleaceae bacterium]